MSIGFPSSFTITLTKLLSSVESCKPCLLEVPPLFSLCEYHVDISQTQSKVVLGFFQQFRPILAWGQTDIKFTDQIGGEQADF